MDRKEKLKSQLEKLEQIESALHSTRDYDGVQIRLNRWLQRTAALVGEIGGPVEKQNIERITGPAYAIMTSQDEIEWHGSKIQNYKTYLADFMDDLQNYEGKSSTSHSEAEERKDVEKPTPFDPQSVFIVHGRDDPNKLKLRDILEREFDLKPKLLSVQPGGGRTIIEKFEQEANECSFAFVLMTPDDTVVSGKKEYMQARPNVFFELGWFYGRIGRDNVCILYKEGTEVPSDLHGISRIQFKAAIEETYLQIRSELDKIGMAKAAS